MYLNMDGKGRLQVPAKVRKRLGLGRRVKAEEKGRNLIIHTGTDENFFLKYGGMIRVKGKRWSAEEFDNAVEGQAMDEIGKKFG